MAMSLVKAEAERLCNCGKHCFLLTVDARGSPPKKKVSPPPDWPGLATNNPANIGIGNALGIVIGLRNDIFVLDIDLPAVLAFGRLQAVHGMLDVPSVRTCSGGFHYYFGYKASVAAGLLNCRNQTKLWVGGERVAIDTRGDGGFVIAPPTQVRGIGKYEWLFYIPW